jgi:alpha-tubulin suppressor-like RCC1 family protein
VGELYCWGRAISGQTGLFDRPLPERQNTPLRVEMSLWADAAVGAGFTCGLLRGGGLRCWGTNGSGQIAQAEAITLEPRPVAVTAPSAQDIDAGNSHACFITRDGARSIQCWGSSGSGRLGIGPMAPTIVRTPTEVAGGLHWTALSLGWAHSCAIADEGRLYCWGYNIAGQLGMGGSDKASRTTPSEVAGAVGGWTVVSSGETHTCAIRDGGQLWCWGENSAGQLSESCGFGDTATPCRVCLEP